MSPEATASNEIAPPVTRAGIVRARSLVDARYRDTPQFVDERLSQLMGTQVVTKVEYENPVRSFKGRGVDHLLKRVPSRDPLLCASAGNFGLALASLAADRGQRCAVFVSEAAPRVKVERLREIASDVVCIGEDFDAAKAEARAHAASHGYRFVEDGAEPELGEGAGTIAAELLDEFPDLEAVLVPVGNGSLVNGIGTWTRAAGRCRTIGVVAAGAPSMYLSWLAGAPVPCENGSTFADGVAVREPVPQAVAQLRDTVDDMILVDEMAIQTATRLLRQLLRAPVEGAGAVALAGLMGMPRPLPRAAAVLVTGANAV